MKVYLRRFLGAALTAGVAVAASGCNDFLEVTNPNELEQDAVDPDRDGRMLSQSVYQAFVTTYNGSTSGNGVPLMTAWFTNEARVGDTFPTRNDIGRRDIPPTNGHTGSLWNGTHVNIQFARTTAASIEAAGNTIDLARAWFVSGFSILYMAETFCQGTIAESTLVPRGPMSSSQLLDSAIVDLQRAQTIANAVTGAAAADLSMAAQVAIARAHLQAGRAAQAASAANAVPAAFEYNALHMDDPSARSLGNQIWGFSEARISLVVGPEFRQMADDGDPRIAYVDMGRVAQDGVLTFFRQDRVENWGDPTRLLSGLEARYIAVEANANPAEMLTFVNERRAVGNQAALVTLDPDALLRELMDQKVRDFWLEGKRLADFRRNPGHVPYVIPTGADTYYKPELGRVHTDTCFPVPQSEINNNPNFG